MDEKRLFWNDEEALPWHILVQRDRHDLLPDMLLKASRESAFYRKKFANFKDQMRSRQSSLEAFDHLPFTDKGELIRDQESNPPFGSNVCLGPQKAIRIHKTSGTSNMPLLILYGPNDINKTRETGARAFWSSGLRPRHTVVHCLNYCMWAGGVTDHLSLEAVGAGVIPFGVGNTHQLAQVLLSMKPHAIHCTPSYLIKLENVLKGELGVDPTACRLQLGLFGAEGGLDDANFRQHLEATWKFTAFNANYGLSECLSIIGSECPMREGMHFHGFGAVYPEIYDPQGGDVLPLEDGVQGELVLTSLVKDVQPLIRYRTRDMIRVINTGKCACGRGTFRFKVLGRTDDMLVIKGLNVFPAAITSIVNNHLSWLNGQLVILVNQRPPIDKFVLKLESALYHDPPADELEKLASDLKSGLGLTPEIQLVKEGSIAVVGNKTAKVLRSL